MKGFCFSCIRCHPRARPDDPEEGCDRYRPIYNRAHRVVGCGNYDNGRVDPRWVVPALVPQPTGRRALDL